VKNDALKQERVLKNHLHRNARLQKQINDLKSSKKERSAEPEKTTASTAQVKETFRKEIWKNAQIRYVFHFI